MSSILAIIRQRRHRRDQTRSGTQQRSQRAVFGVGFAVSAAGLALILAAAMAYASLTRGLPPVEAMTVLLNPSDGQLLQPTRLYDRTGQHLLAVLAPTDAPRTYIPYNQLPPALILASMALTEPNFWVSPGYTLKDWQDPQTHSTLAQRLVFDLILWNQPPSALRAIHERMLAAQLTARYGPQQVMEWYLNSADYGHYAYGAEAAAQFYFGKSVTQTNLSEAAMLAAVSQAPALNPLDAAPAAESRRVQTLLVMKGMGMINDAQSSEAIAAPPSPALGSEVGNIAPAFVSLVLSQLDTRFGAGRVERGGLDILTSLDYGLQLQVACASQTFLSRLTGESVGFPAAADGSVCEAARLLPALKPGETLPGASASAVILDPQTGQVLAAVGDLTGGVQDAILVSHPAGTIITPFIYLTGFSRGLNPASLVWDIPSGTPLPGQSYYHGPVRLRTALANDYLPPAQNVLAQMGVESIQTIASSFGLVLPPDLLASDFDISPLALAGAYGVFANSGVQAGQNITETGIRPAAVLRVSGVDHTIWSDWTTPQSQSLLSPQLAYLMNQVLSDEIARWPSLGHPNPLEIGRPAGAKLSATLNSSAGWTVGYTPQRVAVVWLAGTGKGPALGAVEGSANLWHALIQYTVRDLPSISWDIPSGVVTVNVCEPSGQLPTAACPNVVSEVFLDGRQPVQADTLYQTFQINRETGLLATVFTPPELVEPHTYMVVPSQARLWAQAEGIAAPPTAYDTLQIPPALPEVRITSPAMFADGRGRIKILGTAAGMDFVSYRLEYGQGLYPQAWVQIGADSTTPLTAAALGMWDTTGLDGLYALRLMVMRKDQRVDQAVVQVTLDNTSPQVAISYPQLGQVISLGQEPQVALQAQVNDPFLAKVAFYVDGVLFGESDTAPFGVVWQARSGSHTLHVRATDRAGNTADASLIFTVK
jgi:membrane peptidoglycan carboxypeptidase